MNRSCKHIQTYYQDRQKNSNRSKNMSYVESYVIPYLNEKWFFAYYAVTTRSQFQAKSFKCLEVKITSYITN